MAYGIREVSRRRPCPICGHYGWCGFMPDDDGRETIICKRAVDNAPVAGLDGNNYIFVRQSRNGNFIFMEQSLKEDRDRERGSSNNDTRERRKPVRRTFTVIDEVIPLSHDQLDSVYRYMLSQMVLDDMHRDWLKKEGWSDELIDSNLIKSMPLDDYKRFCRPRGSYYSTSQWRKNIAKACAEKFNTLRGVPGFYKSQDRNGNEKWNIHCRSGILFPQYDLEGKIYALRVRMDFLDAAADIKMLEGGEFSFIYEDEVKYVTPLKGIYTLVDGEKVYDKEGGKYRPFTSYYEDEEAYKKGFIINTFKEGCQAEYGFGFYTQPGDNYYCLYVTEGEKKGILGNALLGAPFMSLPGVNGISLFFKLFHGKRIVDILKEMGVAVIIVAFDADKATNDKVLACQDRAVQLLREEGFMVATAEWDINVGKGIDDLLAAGEKPKFQLI